MAATAPTFRLWAMIGLNSFGGPAGQIAVMHRELVDRRAIIAEDRFLHALNFCMLLPGPEAQQLATYLGWLMRGVRGGLIAGLLFIAPGAVVMLGLSMAYVTVGDVPLIRNLVIGLQSAVIALVIQAVVRVGRRTLRSAPLIAIAAGSFVCVALLHVPFPAVILAAAFAGWLTAHVRRRPDVTPPADSTHGPTGVNITGGTAAIPEPTPPSADPRAVPTTRSTLLAAAGCAGVWLLPLVLLLVLSPGSIYSQQAVLFSTTAVVSFGGAYAVLGYVAQQAVTGYGWVTARDMTTGLGLAETTPGPLILVVQFIAFVACYNAPGSLPPLLAGCLGALIALWMTFAPCFMFVFAGAPFMERLRSFAPLHSALTGIGAAVTGVIASLAVLFMTSTLFAQWPVLSSLQVVPLIIALVALVLVFVLKRGTPTVLITSCALGVVSGWLPLS